MIGDDVYKSLKAMKERYRCESFSQLLRKFSHDFEARDFLANEISEMFYELKAKVVKTTLNGRMSGLFETIRIATIRIAKLHPAIRKQGIDKANIIFEKAMKEILKECEELEKKLKTLKENKELKELEL